MDASTPLDGVPGGVLGVQVLGPVRVTRDGLEVAIHGRKERRVLAVLVAAAGDPVSVDELVEALWFDEPPRTAGGVTRCARGPGWRQSVRLDDPQRPASGSPGPDPLARHPARSQRRWTIRRP